MNHLLITSRAAFIALLLHLKTIPGREIFGFGIGISKDGINVLHAFLFPRQLEWNKVHCSIDNGDISLLTNLIYDLKEKHKVEEKIQLHTWVHTHPGLSIFLSGTDKATLTNWHRVNNNMMAVVIDPFANQNYKAFSADFEEAEYRLEDIEISENLASFYEELTEQFEIVLSENLTPPECIATPTNSWVNKKPWQPNTPILPTLISTKTLWELLTTKRHEYLGLYKQKEKLIRSRYLGKLWLPISSGKASRKRKQLSYKDYLLQKKELDSQIKKASKVFSGLRQLFSTATKQRVSKVDITDKKLKWLQTMISE